jgi:phage terminase large subunit
MNFYEEIREQNKRYNPKIFKVKVDGEWVGGKDYLTYQEATALADECKEEKHDGVKTKIEIVEVITLNTGEI